ncbi:MAG: RHS repeat-associated core domain-containing protein [Ruminococcaceae bacterium]|nr:RHS repeat-associated core domain-containing protein [Oscillospiraceae bacterium]
MKSGNGSMAVAANTNTPNPRTIYPRTGNYLLKLHLPTGSAADDLCTVYQSMYLKAGETYVFSGYVNTACSSVFADEGGAYLSILNSGNEEQKASRMINHKTNVNIEDGWERLEVTFSPKTSGTYRLAANWKGSSQVVAFDDFQMERVVETAREDETTEEETTPVGAASGVNLLQMGGFQFVGTTGSATTSGYSTYWPNTAGTTASYVTDSTRGGYVLKMTAYPSTNFHYSQTVNINASSNSTYILSGWGKATSAMNNGIALHGNNDGDTEVEGQTSSTAPFFGFIVKIVYADSSLAPEYQHVSFNHDCTDWQYVTGVIVPEEKDQTVSTMTVSLAYDYNLNFALFDDVALVQEPVQTYSYDDEGNMLTASDSENAQTSAEYDSSDRLTGYTTMSGVSYALTYSGTSRDPATITSDGVRTTYTYTANGQVSRESTVSTSGGKALVTSYGFDSNGDFTTSVSDVNGNSSSLAYDPYTRQIAKTTDAAENQVFYQYNSRNGRPTTIYQTGVAALTFGYENGSQTSVNRKSFRTTDGITTTNWQRYYTQLNQWGLPTSVTVSSSTDGESWSGGITLTQNEYDNGYGNLVKKTMANGQCVEYHYDSLDRLVKTVYYSSTGAVQTSHVYVYNAQGQLSAQYATDANGSVIERYFYEYDSLGRLICSRELDGEEEPVQRVMQCYDTANRLVSQRWHIGERGFTETYSYNAGDGSLSSISSPMGETITLSYDALKRNTGHTVTKSGTELFKNTWNYWDRTDNTTLTTAQVRYFNYRDADAGLIQGWMYAYDARGNISTIYESETPYRVLAKYEYDSLNQLTKETTYTYSGTSTTATSTTVNTFTYDTAGNLLTASNNGITSRYTYGDNNWTDLLTKFKGVTINYDGSGNPTNWYNGTSYSNLTWERGRQLTSIKKGTNTYTYDYDMSGVRSSKTVNGVVHNYVTQSGKVVLETYGDYMLFFVYDQDGRPFALRYSTNDGSSFTTCYYILNLQGDVVALYNASGIIAKYSYDAWGKLLSVTNANGTSITSSSHIANINPLRYRGYYYDAETGFYYLQSRYYDPAVKRFINADALPSTGQEFAGYNMFAYCGNNPVTRSDIQGTSWKDFVEEMDRRFVHCMKTIGRIVTSPFKALSAEAGVGVGLGVDAKVNACGIPLEVGAVASVSDSVVYDKGKFDVRSRTSTSFAFNFLKVFGFSYTQGHEHSYFDEQCTCNAWEDSYGEKSECPANEPFEEGSSIISFSAGVYLVLGFNLSVSFDLAAWGDELTSIYYDSVNYGK